MFCSLEQKQIYLSASISSFLQLVAILSNLQTYRVYKGQKGIEGIGSLRAIIRTVFHVPQQKELLHLHEPGKDRPWGKFYHNALQNKKSIQVTIWR